MSADFFADYHPEGFCEAFAPSGPRSHYQALVRWLEAMSAPELDLRARMASAIFRNLGITFALYGQGADAERTWPMDLIPRIIPPAEWDVLERGLTQRVRALSLFLDDLYVGQQAGLEDGVVPRWLVESSPGYLRQARGVPAPHGSRVAVAGIDLVRDGAGTWRVLEDNLRVPSGVSYVLENRVAMTRVLPVAFSRHEVRPVNHYAAALLEALRSISPPGAGELVNVVVLTPGVRNSAYFEHAFLARQMGVELVEGRDLVVEDHVLYMRTTRGLQRVDVVYRRVADEYLDPVVFRSDSLLGVPGLMAAARAGTVTLANAVGNGAADDKAVYAFVPDMIRYYLGEEPVLPNVTTYLPWEPDQLEHVLGRLDQLVVKPVAEAGGEGIVIGSQAGAEELARTAARLRAEPRRFVAQETVQLSTHPTFVDGRVRPRHVDLRPFVISGDRVNVMPGGLTRVALREGSLIVNSSQGGGSKDTWVLGGEG